MIRVLYIHRQPGGNGAKYAEHLSAAIASHCMEGVVDDGSAWIPNETGWKVDRQVSVATRDAAKGFDIVHAIGLRSAWACGEAFYLKRPWVYTVYDWPKSTHQQVIDRLSSARAGLCSTRAIRRVLEDCHAVNLEFVCPGIPTPALAVGHGDERKSALGLAPDSSLIVVVPSGLIPRLEAADDLHQDLAVSGHDATIHLLNPERENAQNWISAADVVVVPGEKCGFDPLVAEAMWLGKPVVVRESGGLSEFGVKDVSILTFENDDDLSICVAEAMHSAVFLSSLGGAARARAHERFDLHDSVSKHVEIYRDLTSR